MNVEVKRGRINALHLEEDDVRNDMFYGEIAWLLDLVESKAVELINAGVCFEESQIWMTYYYEGQCNMEFDSLLLKRMGDLDLKLCVTCIQDYFE